MKLIGETDTHYTMHDGRSPFVVPKEGLSEATHAKIRGFAEPQKLADGGAAYNPDVDPGVYQPTWTLPAEAQRNAAYASGLRGVFGALEHGVEKATSPEVAARLERERDAAQKAADKAEAEQKQRVLEEKRKAEDIAHPRAFGWLPRFESSGESDDDRRARAMLEDKGSAIPGLRPSGETPTETKVVSPGMQMPGAAPGAAPQAPFVYQSPYAAEMAKLQGGTGGGTSGVSSALSAEQKAVALKGELEARQAEQQAAELKARGRAMLDLQAERAAAMQLAQRRTQEAMARVQADRDALSKIDMSIDPGRFWATRSTGGKIAGVIGLALGTMGGAKDGINRAAEMLNRFVDQDIEVQKAEHDARMRLGQAKLEASKSLYGMAREAMGDDLAAVDAAKASALEQSINRINAIAASSASPMAKANAQQLVAQLTAQKAQADQAAGQRVFENKLKLTQLDLEARKEAFGEWEARQKASAAGVGPAELKDLKDAEASAQNAYDKIARIKQLLAETQSNIPGGTALAQNKGEKARQLKAEATSLFLDLKQTAKLGQFSEADAALIEKLAGDPTAILTSEASKLAQLNELQSIVQRGIENHRRAVYGAKATPSTTQTVVK